LEMIVADPSGAGSAARRGVAGARVVRRYRAEL